MTNKKGGKIFAEEPQHVANAGKEGTGAIAGNLKKDPGRAVEAGHRSHEQRRGSGDQT